MTKIKEKYIELALKTELKDYNEVSKRYTPEMARLMHSAMGIATEGGEFLDMLKKHINYGKPFDRTNAIEELGDLLFYIAIACDELGVSFEEVQNINIKKLQERFKSKGKFNSEEAINRDHSKEKKVMENVN